jgi:2-keto-4-pentenoate hydratase/2-oxohepta-3-ene-1,7-dioic acid hydratase in catechol pathway
MKGTLKMKLIRIGEFGSEKPGVLVGPDQFIDLSDIVEDFNESFFASGLLKDLEKEVRLKVLASQIEAIGSRRIGAPIARPHQIICIGLNYRDHAVESGMAVPDEPIIFTKSPNTLVGPNDDVIKPRKSEKLDWEVELGVVIAHRAKYLNSVDSARSVIAGYLVVNDVSERAFQLERGGQWSKGKSAETFNPAGPWLVTPDEIENVLDLEMTLDVNGLRRQTGSTKTMVFNPWEIVHYLSQFMVLEPGDLINTGTPPGVAMGMKPPVYLEVGDTMELCIELLGSQRQRVISGF